MLHDYDNPNTCYAIGDSFSVYMGSGTVVRQPASGVFEEVSAIQKDQVTDQMEMYNGSLAIRLFISAARTDQASALTGQVATNPFNMAIKIGNTVYLRKEGTTNTFAASGVQVDA